MSDRIEGYRPALDGLRAVAVVGVILYHSPVGWAPGGFLGVDVFFVLSGYLITGLLLAERRTWGSIDLLSFYRARARRLLPALLLVVSTVSLIGPHLLTEQARTSLRGDAVASLFYVANWRFVVEGSSYFAAFGDPSPFRHLWTLAIEEQFYLVFPILLSLLAGVLALGRRQVAACLAGLAIVSVLAGMAMYTPGGDPSRVYYGTDTRVHELLVGAVLATLLASVSRSRRAGRTLDVAAVVLVVGLLLSFVLVRESADYLFLGGSLVFCVGVAALIAVVEIAPGCRVGRLLAAAPLVWVGRLSYGLYLWHWPVMVFLDETRTGWSPLLLFAVQAVVTATAATLSYVLVEQPIRRGGLRRVPPIPRTVALAASIPAVLVAVLVGTVGAAPALPAAAPGETLTSSAGPQDASTRILVVGDSVGFSLAFSFPVDDYPDVAVDSTIKSGCGTAEHWLVVNGVRHPTGRPDCEKQFAEWASASDRFRPTVTLWTMGAWEVYDHVVDGKVLTVESQAYREHLLARMERGLESFAPTSRVVIPNVPCYNQPRIVEAGQDMSPDRNDPRRASAVNAVITEFAARHRDRVEVLDVASWLCPGGRYQREVDGVDLREDGVHYRHDAVPTFWRWAMPKIERDG